MAERNAWTHVEEAIHRLGGWYADQRVVDELRPVIDRYAATLGYAPSPEPTVFQASAEIESRPVTVDEIPDEVRELIADEAAVPLKDEIARLMSQLIQVQQVSSNFQAESRNKDNQVMQLTAIRNTWMDKAQELETERDKLIRWREQDARATTAIQDGYSTAKDEIRRLKADREKDTHISRREELLHVFNSWFENSSDEHGWLNFDPEDFPTPFQDRINELVFERARDLSGGLLQEFTEDERRQLEESLEQLRRGETKPATTLAEERENSMTIPTWDGAPPAVDPGGILDQACAAAERAEKAADGAAEAVLKILTRLYPGSFQVGSDGRVWTLVGVLDDDTDLTEADINRMIANSEPVEVTSKQEAGRERIRNAAKESAAPLVQAAPPSGMKRCSSCETMKPLEKFRKDSSKVSGYRSQCKDCQAGAPSTFKAAHDRIMERPEPAVTSTTMAREAAVTRAQDKFLTSPPVIRTVSAGTLSVLEKTCNECTQTKPVEAFSKDAKSSGGVKGKCKVCCSRRDALNAQRKREAKQS